MEQGDSSAGSGIQNAYYTIMVDYSKNYSFTEKNLRDLDKYNLNINSVFNDINLKLQNV